MNSLTAVDDNKKSERERIGQRIAELRTQKGYSVRQLSEISGISFQNITKIEHGKYSVGLDVLQKIADALGCRVEVNEAV